MKKLRIHYLQHVPFEGLGCIETWIRKKEHPLSVTRFYQHEPLPPVEEPDWLIVLGGPMGIYDQEAYPWLGAEKAFIKQAIEQHKVVLGICLGAQLIADALGARVYAGKEKEIGWFPIRKTAEGKEAALLAHMPDALSVFHWHGDTFDIPAGAKSLAESAACAHQAFLYEERVLGLQFHFEATPDSVRQMLKYCKDDLEPASPYVQSPDDIERGIKCCEENNRVMFSILEYLENQEQTKKKKIQ